MLHKYSVCRSIVERSHLNQEWFTYVLWYTLHLAQEGFFKI